VLVALNRCPRATSPGSEALIGRVSRHAEAAGYPADKIGRGKKNRKPLKAVAHRERYGQPFE